MPDEQPWPPRRRWLKRISVGAVIIVAAVAALRWWAGKVTHDRLAAAMAAIRAKGEPIAPADYNLAPVDDNDNAAAFLRAALNNWPRVNGNYVTDVEGDDPVTDNAQYLADAADAIKLVRRARQCRHTVWRTSYSSPVVGLHPEYAQMRRLARLMEDAALRHHRLRNDREAVELMRDLFVVARAVESPPSEIVAHLVGISIRAIAVELVESPEMRSMRISLSNEPPTPGTQPATRQQIDKLKSEFLDDQALRTALKNALIGERVFQYDVAMQYIEQNPNGSLSLGDLGFLNRCWLFGLRPIHVQQLTQALSRITDSIGLVATDQNHWQTTVSMSRAGGALPLWFNPIGELVASTAMLSQSHYADKARMRLAGVALAIRQYKIAHGKYPDSLAQLVPEYLSQIPADPFDPEGGPLRYVPEGVKASLSTSSAYYDADEIFGSGIVPSQNVPEGVSSSPSTADKKVARRFVIVYSFGRDMRDDGGGFELDEDGAAARYDTTGAARDIVFLIDELPAPPNN